MKSQQLPQKKELNRSNSQNKKSVLTQRNNQSLKDTSLTRDTQQSSYFGGDEQQKLFETIQRLEVENNEKDLAIEKATQIIDVLSKDLENATSELQKLDLNRQELKERNKQLEIENNDLNQIIEKLKSEESSLQTASFDNDPVHQYHPNFNSTGGNNLLNLSAINKTGFPNSTIQLGNNSLGSDRFYNEEKAKINSMIDEYESIIDDLNNKCTEYEQQLISKKNQVDILNAQLNQNQGIYEDGQMKLKKENDVLREKVEKLKRILQQSKVHLRSYQLSAVTPLSKSRIRSGFYANNDYLLNKRNERSLMEQSKSDISISEIGTDDYNNTFRNSTDAPSQFQSTQKFSSPIFRIREEAENEEETSSCRNSKSGQQIYENDNKQRGKSHQPRRNQIDSNNQQKRSSSLNSSKDYSNNLKNNKQNDINQQNYDVQTDLKDSSKQPFLSYQQRRQIKTSPQQIQINKNQEQNQNIKVFDESQIYSNRDDEEDEDHLKNNIHFNNNENNQIKSGYQEPFFFNKNSPNPFDSNQNSLKNSAEKSRQFNQGNDEIYYEDISQRKNDKIQLNSSNPFNQEEDFDKEVHIFQKEFQQELERRETELWQQFEEILNRQIGDKNQEIDEYKKIIDENRNSIDLLKMNIEDLNKNTEELKNQINDNLKNREEQFQEISYLKKCLEEKENRIKKVESEYDEMINSVTKTSNENEGILKNYYEKEIDTIQNKLKEAEDQFLQLQKQNQNLLTQKDSAEDELKIMQIKLKELEKAEDSLQTQININQLLSENKKVHEKQVDQLQLQIKMSEDALLLETKQNRLLQEQNNQILNERNEQEKQKKDLENQKNLLTKLNEQIEKEKNELQKQKYDIEIINTKLENQKNILESQKIDLENQVKDIQRKLEKEIEKQLNYQDLIAEKNILIQQNCKTIQDLSLSRESQIKNIENQVIHFGKEFHEGQEKREQELLQQFEMKRQITEKNQEIEDLRKKIIYLEQTRNLEKGEDKAKENLLKERTNELSQLVRSHVESELALKKSFQSEIDALHANLRKSEESLLHSLKQNTQYQENVSELEKKIIKQSKQMELLEDQIQNYSLLLQEKNLTIDNHSRIISELKTNHEFDNLQNLQMKEKKEEIYEMKQSIYEKNKELDEKCLEIDELQRRIGYLEDNLDILQKELNLKEKLLDQSTNQLQGRISHMHKSSTENEMNLMKQHQQFVEELTSQIDSMTQSNQILTDSNHLLQNKLEKAQKHIKSLEDQKSSCLDLLTEKNLFIENNQKDISELSSQKEISTRKIDSLEYEIKSLENRVSDLLKYQENIYNKIKAIVEANQLNSPKLFDQTQIDSLINILDLAITRQKGQDKLNNNFGLSSSSSSPKFTNYEQIKLLLKYLPNSLQHLCSSQEQAMMNFNQETIQDAVSNKLIFNLQDYCHLIARNWVNFLKDLHSIFKNIENNVLDLQNAIDGLKNFDIMGIMVVCYNQVATNFTYHQEKYDSLFNNTQLMTTSSFNQPSQTNNNNQFLQSNNSNLTQNQYNSTLSSGNSTIQTQSNSNNNNNEISSIRNAIKIAEKYTSKLEERVVRSNNFQQVLQDTKVIMQVLEENLQNTVQRFLNSCVELRSTPITNKKYLYSSFNSLLIEHAQDEMINIRNALKLLDIYYLNSLKVSRNVIKERGEKNNIVILQIIKKISELAKKKQHLTALINEDLDNLNIEKVMNNLKDIYIYNSIPNIPLIHSNNSDKKHFLQNQIYELARENAGYKLALNNIYMASTRIS